MDITVSVGMRLSSWVPNTEAVNFTHIKNNVLIVIAYLKPPQSASCHVSTDKVKPHKPRGYWVIIYIFSARADVISIPFYDCCTTLSLFNYMYCLTNLCRTMSNANQQVKAKRFYVLSNKGDYRTLLHSPLKMWNLEHIRQLRLYDSCFYIKALRNEFGGIKGFYSKVGEGALLVRGGGGGVKEHCIKVLS